MIDDCGLSEIQRFDTCSLEGVAVKEKEIESRGLLVSIGVHEFFLSRQKSVKLRDPILVKKQRVFPDGAQSHRKRERRTKCIAFRIDMCSNKKIVLLSEECEELRRNVHLSF